MPANYHKISLKEGIYMIVNKNIKEVLTYVVKAGILENNNVNENNLLIIMYQLLKETGIGSDVIK